MTALALATLGGVTKNRNNPIYVMPPKVAMASTIVTVICRCCHHYCLKNIANVYEPLVMIIYICTKHKNYLQAYLD